MLSLLIIGIVTAFNFIIIMWKLSKERFLDAGLDFTLFVVIAFLFSGTVSGLTVGMVASCLISFYLLISPPKLPSL